MTRLASPVSFEVNRGQTDREVKFLARGAGYSQAIAQCHLLCPVLIVS